MTRKNEIKALLQEHTENPTNATQRQLQEIFYPENPEIEVKVWHWPSLDDVDARLRCAVAHSKEYMFCEKQYLVGPDGIDGVLDVQPLYDRVRATMHSVMQTNHVCTPEARANLVDVFGSFCSYWTDNSLSECGWTDVALIANERVQALGGQAIVPSRDFRESRNKQLIEASFKFCESLSQRFLKMYEGEGQSHLSLVPARSDTPDGEKLNAIESSP